MKPPKSNKFAILKNEDPIDHVKWIDACKKIKSINYKVFDLTLDTWLEDINSFSPDVLLLKPSGKTSLYRTLYQERLEILIDELNYKSFPLLQEIKIYENKRYFAYWARAHKLPHPKTWIFYHQKEVFKVLNSLMLGSKQ